MKNLEITDEQYQKMLEIAEDFAEISKEELTVMVEKGAELVAKNRGFANIDMKSTYDEMVNIGAFIEYRTAKKLLGEYVEEIDD
ncbi:hypothetical protein ACF3N7_05300 [Cruoricaptor ignavus]|uniref:hypothetical protein n=1 Tax=Cruoricaptor ignavus TaxID=1118202 RepID=UPI00370DDF75